MNIIGREIKVENEKVIFMASITSNKIKAQKYLSIWKN